MNNTLKYILSIGGLVVLTLAVLLYLKPELLSFDNAPEFPERVINDTSDVPLGQIIYDDSEYNRIDTTDNVTPTEFIQEESVVILYQEIVTEGAEPVRFSGIFQEYNTGCFADGECYVVVDGQRVTTLLGWSNGVVGTFEDPDIPVGTEVEVYALPTESGNYTLYGSTDYYVRAL